MSKFQRKESELREATKAGRLYQIVRIHGHYAVACRCRWKKNSLFRDLAEKITLERQPGSKLVMEPGDFAFVDAGGHGRGRCWSLWKVQNERQLNHSVRDSAGSVDDPRDCPSFSGLVGSATREETAEGF